VCRGPLVDGGQECADLIEREARLIAAATVLFVATASPN
jgi:hypothetical protein